MAVSETLRTVIDAGRSSKRLDELSSARVIGKIAQQVHAAQQKAGSGKAIGPIAPAHITLLPSGEAKLEVGDSTPAMGYSSPEQASGGTGDRRSDVFSLGAILWEALTHTRLFEAANDAAVRAAVMSREIAAPVEVNANIPAELSAICMRALARNPTDRYQSLKAMAVEIEEFLEEAGYANDDSRIAQHLTAMHLPAVTKQSPIAVAAAASASASVESPHVTTQPMPTIASAKHVGPVAPPGNGTPATTTPPATTASGTKPPQNVPLPSILKDPTEPKADPKATILGIAPISTPEGWEDKKAPILTPLPPVLPATVVEAKGTDPHQTQPLGFAPRPPATEEPAKPEAPVKAAEPAKAEAPAKTVEPAKSEAPVKAAEPVQAEEAKAPAVDDKATTLVDDKPPEAVIEAAAAAALAPPAVEATPVVEAKAEPKTAEATPSEAPTRANVTTDKAAKAVNPADVVSLPQRDSKADLLSGWGWGTGKHDAIAPTDYAGSDDDQYDDKPPNPKKTLTYVIGGAVAVALLFTVIALAARGSKSKKKPDAPAPTAASATEPATPRVDETPTPVETPATQPGSGSAEPAIDQAAADKAAADKAAADKAAADKAAADKIATDKAAAEQAKKDEAARKADEANAEKLAKEEAARQAKEEARLAKEEAAKQKAAKAAADKAAGKSTTTTTKTDPKKADKVVAKADTNNNTKAVDVETAYRIGLQQFARGDTTGALASLRTSLAGNPNYAPTWRGLGLVFEKMGDKAQARAAYKKYLQLAPTAGDAEIIRGRLERLGS